MASSRWPSTAIPSTRVHDPRETDSPLPTRHHRAVRTHATITNWKAVSPSTNEYLERVKAEIRAEADAARARTPLPRIDPPPRAAVARDDGIDRARLDYAIGELTGADYRAFIDHAFRALLKRPPDDAGSEVQMRLLAAGAAKAEVLGNLRWSPEGRRIGTRVRGLLPRYLLAKLVRVPVFGYVAEWGLAFAGLPMLLRHQRAADTANAARFNTAADAQREQGERLAELRTEHDRCNETIRDDIGRMLLRLDQLEHLTARLDGRVHGLEQRTDASAREMVELRHYVHAANHWVGSLQRSLGELEEAAATQRERAESFAAMIEDGADERAARQQRHSAWSAVLAAQLPQKAGVLDLGSGDGAWLAALLTRELDASGVEANAALVARAQERRLAVALGDPLAALERCADASLEGITLSSSLLMAGASDASRLLGESLRALKPSGRLLLHIEADSYRFFDPATAGVDPQRVGALLVAAGFVAPVTLPAIGGDAVIARRNEP